MVSKVLAPIRPVRLPTASSCIIDKLEITANQIHSIVANPHRGCYIVHTLLRDVDSTVDFRGSN